MAGIGFELRKLLTKRSYFGLLQAYTYAGIISSGPWVLSIIGIMLIGLLSFAVVVPNALIAQFQVTVTYLFLSSLVITGIVQLSFTRFVADRLFAKDDASILPNFNGLLFLALNVSMLLALPIAMFLFPEQTVLYRLLFVIGLAIMSGIWIATVFLTGMKHYKAIVLIFFLGYGATLVFALLFRYLYNMEGLLLGFVLGHFLLLAGMIWLIYRNYHSDRLIAFEIWHKGQMYRSLMLTGFFFNLGVWIDKIMFWYWPLTSQHVIGPLRASVIYDIPIFFSYLTVIPGMAVFLVRMETDFAEKHKDYYGAIHGGATLGQIAGAKDEMVDTIRQGLLEIAKIQGLGVLFAMIWGPSMLRWLGISQLYQRLLYIDVVAAGLQVVFLGLCNVLFYLDKRRAVLGLSLLLLAANLILTMASVSLGTEFYGYGFAAALLLAVLAGLWTLDRILHDLEFRTFMRRP